MFKLRGQVLIFRLPFNLRPGIPYRYTFERKIFRRIYGPTQEGGCWRPRWSNELYSLYKELNIVENIKIRRLEWAGHIIRIEEERIPKKRAKRKLPYHKTSGKTKN
jgi:hypothetical protein